MHLLHRTARSAARHALTRTRSLAHTLTLALLLLTLHPFLHAANPIYFRSDHGLPTVTPGSIPADLGNPAHLLWKTPTLPGQSSPIIVNNRIFLTTHNTTNNELAIVCLDLRDGSMLWKRGVPTQTIETFHQQMGSAAVATPASDGSRLFVFFGSYGLICLNLDGSPAWEQRMGPFQDEYGAGSSPILVNDSLILLQDHDINSFLLALDPVTGRQRWRIPRPDAVRSYSTPAVWSHNGTNELLIAGALELASFNPANGNRLWWTHGLARIVIPVPLPTSNTIFMASWAPGGDSGRRLQLDPWPTAIAKWDKNQNNRLTRTEIDNADVLDRFFRMDLDQSGDLTNAEWEKHADVFRKAQNALLAIRPDHPGELPDSAILWKHQRGVPYVTSPLLHNNILWMVKEGGIVTKLDATTGKLLAEERLGGVGSYYASPIAADNKIFFASEQGVVTVLANSPDWKILSTHAFGEKIHATPTAAGSRLLFRTTAALYCFSTPTPKTKP